jgi:hypothetical protein
MPTVILRPWQRAAYEAFRASPDPDYLAVATPGAGKTTFALTCARASLADEPRTLVVVAPTSHLKVQWSLAAHRLGLQLDPDWSPGDGLARDVHGLVTTYQQIATGNTAAKLAGLSADGFVILDEIHHAGHEKAWGDGVRIAFGHAARRLSLSGTPFRSDAVQIPFVRYDATGEGDMAHADYTYGYADALRDGGVVRPVYFPRVDGDMEWTTAAGDVINASFQDELAKDQMSMRLRTALSLEGEWMPSVLARANEQLRSIRQEQRDAGGLVIAIDQDHAQGIARQLRDRFGTPADVVVSDDPTASKKIAEFSQNDRPWLVAVRMVSEGVDIPRPASRRLRHHDVHRAVLPPGGRAIRALAGRTSEPEGVRVHPRRPSPAHPRVRDRRGPPPRAATAREATTTATSSRSTGVSTRRSIPTTAPNNWRCSPSCRPRRPTSRSTPSPSRVCATSRCSTPTTSRGPLRRRGRDRRAAVRRRSAAQHRPPRDPDRCRARALGIVERGRTQGRPAHAQRPRRQAPRRPHGVEPRQGAGRDESARRCTRVATATTEQLERRLRYAESWLRRLQR